MKTLSQDNFSPDRDLNPGFFGYEAGMLTSSLKSLVPVIYSF
jgi:hypothetical protein